MRCIIYFERSLRIASYIYRKPVFRTLKTWSFFVIIRFLKTYKCNKISLLIIFPNIYFSYNIRIIHSKLRYVSNPENVSFVNVQWFRLWKISKIYKYFIIVYCPPKHELKNIFCDVYILPEIFILFYDLLYNCNYVFI